MGKNNFLKSAILLISFLVLSCNDKREEVVKNQFIGFITEYYINYPQIENKNDINNLDIYLKSNYPYIREINNDQYSLSIDQQQILTITDTILDIKAKVNLKSIKKSDNCVGDKLTKGFFSKNFIRIGGFSFQEKMQDYFQNKNYSVGVPFFNKKGPLNSNKKLLFKFQEGQIYIDCYIDLDDGTLIKKIEEDLKKFIEENRNYINFDYALIPLEINQDE